MYIDKAFITKSLLIHLCIVNPGFPLPIDYATLHLVYSSYGGFYKSSPYVIKPSKVRFYHLFYNKCHRIFTAQHLVLYNIANLIAEKYNFPLNLTSTFLSQITLEALFLFILYWQIDI